MGDGMFPSLGVALQIATVLLATWDHASADVYLHMPRGSNNRLNEATRNRNNPNRLFDSQNNNRGGYNVGQTYYYQGSKVTFEWTNQHSCSDENNNCEIILQYMCEKSLRDGSVVSRIPLNPIQCEDWDCSKDIKFGMHEHLDSYLRCRATQRGYVYSADQLFNSRQARILKDKMRYSAIRTRQNPNGIRYGYECPEERDYYPYWNPSQWRDIAILTKDIGRCPYYQRESQNVKARGQCRIPTPMYYWWTRCRELSYSMYRQYVIDQPMPHYYPAPHDQATCESMTYNHTAFQAWLNTQHYHRRSRCRNIPLKNDPTKTNASDSLRYEWVVVPSHGIAAPLCREAPWSRDNHLGNGIGGFPNTFNWTVPGGVESDTCAFRVRYNISTNDYDSWSISKANDSIYMNLNFTFSSPDAAKVRGFEFKKNPTVDVFDTPNLRLRLAINTAQFGRTFQDRSHSFAIRKRPPGVDQSTRIHNVQVRGKRGNIVQTYPGVEYDFVPNRLVASKGDLIHFQWTGSNSNPLNNDGQGQRGSDRHNAVLLRNAVYAEGTANASGDIRGQFGASYPSLLSSDTLLGFSREQAEKLALLKSPGNLLGTVDPELDDMSPHFDNGLAALRGTGTYHYMCTRNNNFSNRNQKGKITVVVEGIVSDTLDASGGTIALQTASLLVLPNSLETRSVITVSTFTPAECQLYLNRIGSAVFHSGESISDCILIEPEDIVMTNRPQMMVTMNFTSTVSRVHLSKIKVHGTVVQSGALSWALTSSNTVDLERQTVTFPIAHGGLYIAKSASSVPVTSIIFAVSAFGILVLCVALYVHQKPETRFYGFPKQVSRGLSHMAMSFKSEV